jgi:hypothetical protein
MSGHAFILLEPLAECGAGRSPQLAGKPLGYDSSDLRQCSLSEDYLALEAGRLVALEMRVISAEKDAHQAVGISQDLARNALTLQTEEIDQTIHRTGDTPVNERI